MLPTLIASELFGHEKGAFTGADHQHIGAFERADGGTLFLDEIGELPPSLQTALLGALERRSFRRVGGKSSIAVDVRVIAATHRDLRGEVNTGTFRQDLFYRLAVIVLQIPALRERREDVPLLAEHFVRLTGYDGPLEEVLPEKTMEMLQTYWWPGNVRELRNMVEAAVVMGEAPSLSERGPEPESSRQAPAAGARVGATSEAEPGQTIPVGQVMTLPYSEARNVVIDHFEDLYLGALLERCRGNVALAARQAKMNRSYLTRMIKRRGIERP
jgi:DNA-binding NtrC family response regulator